MIKTNSELPLTLLESHNVELNDYDFVLFHLYLSNPSYRAYFDDLRVTHPERMMILDNSAYEFYVKGETLDLDLFTKAIIELNPDYYILPDTLMDKKQTLRDTMIFRSTHQRFIENSFEYFNMEPPQPIAVAQGNTIEEFNDCLTELLYMGYKNIALPFHNRFFKEEFFECEGPIAYEFAKNGYNYCTEDVRYAMGRCEWLAIHGTDLLFDGDKPRFDRLHFLGSHCPAEKAFYSIFFCGMDNVSMDTGYPVKLAIQGEVLGKEKEKPNIIIDDFMENEIDPATVQLIEDNVNKFREY